ncbi:FxSxx-COOH cyclophane-containing RiPP peptide [Streptomyces sp. NPDC059096]|uniref:FxSxx-COOH cyclophane-containing RiPP peptide n=1 Tax=Streptomyces sp. NPDC059096 TaxID=3346727 RepID=UPI0036C30996
MIDAAHGGRERENTERGNGAYGSHEGGPGGAAALPPGTAGELPDLLALDLAALRTLDHPVLSEVMADLRGRAEQPRDMLWGFNNAF